MQLSLRRKLSPPALFSAAAAAASSFSMKPAASAARRGGNLSVFVVIVTIFLFGCFMYNEDVKSIAEFPFSRPREQEITTTIHENQRSINVDTKTTTVSVVMNARTVVETEVEGGGVDDGGEKKREILKGPEEEGSKPIQMTVQEEEDEDDDDVEIPPASCDLFTGQWVFDNSSYPIYKEDQCEFLTAQVTCLRNGRRDSLYQNWRWQPRDCSMPK